MTSTRTLLTEYRARRVHPSDMPREVSALYWRDEAHRIAGELHDNRGRHDLDWLNADLERDLDYANERRRAYIRDHRNTLRLERAVEQALANTVPAEGVAA